MMGVDVRCLCRPVLLCWRQVVVSFVLFRGTSVWVRLGDRFRLCVFVVTVCRPTFLNGIRARVVLTSWLWLLATSRLLGRIGWGSTAQVVLLRN